MSQEELKKEDLKGNPSSVTFAQLSKLILNQIEGSNSRSSLTTKYTKEQIIGFLENPQRHEKQLRILSKFLFITNQKYRRLIQYFANMPTFDYVVHPRNLDIENIEIDKFKKQYLKIVNELENMNIPHEMAKALLVAFKEDVFYGYEHSTKQSYFIQKLNPDFCRISSVEDGIYNFEFDFSYFDTNKDALKLYAQEFKAKYEAYKKDKQNKRWQELNSKKTICLKINEDITYALPPFAGVFESLFDVDETRRLKNVRNKLDNYLILTQLIPIDEKTGESNKFLIDLDTAISFHNKAIQSLPEEVGLVTTPMKIDAIRMEKNRSDTDTVAQAERGFYNDSGVPQALFNSDKMNNASLNKSVVTDEQIIFGVLRQIERWVNRKLKFISGKYKFRVEFLNTTVFNRKEVSEQYLKAAQYGMPVKQELAASLGLAPSALISKVFLENEVMELTDKLQPLASSHTQSAKDQKDGRPQLNEDELTDEGLDTRNGDKNLE